MNLHLPKVNPYEIMAKIFDNKSIITDAYSSTAKSSGYAMDNSSPDARLRT